MTGPYTRVTYHGKTMNARTKAMVQQAEDYLGYELTILQGSYHKGVGASAGTHDGGGVLDFAPWDHEKKVRVLRMIGFAAWYRPTIKDLWNEHIHAVAVRDKEMSSEASKQVQDYYAGLDGLKYHRKDDEWRPNVIVPFQYPLLPVDFSNVVKEAKTGGKNALNGVKRIQRALNTKTGTHLTVDGKFGVKTKAAYKRYERQVGGDGDGVPGDYSLKRLGLALFKVVQ